MKLDPAAWPNLFYHGVSISRWASTFEIQNFWHCIMNETTITPDYEMNCMILKYMYKYTDVIITNNLNLNLLIDHIVNKANCTLGYFRKYIVYGFFWGWLVWLQVLQSFDGRMHCHNLKSLARFRYLKRRSCPKQSRSFYFSRLFFHAKWNSSKRQD